MNDVLKPGVIPFFMLFICCHCLSAIGNDAPIADAGLPRYAGTDSVQLDGSGSYDADFSGVLSYQWQQVSGPPVTISDGDTVRPTISGFVQTDSIQRCEFELVVNDGESDSLADTVEVIIVPSFAGNTMALENTAFDPDKPTIIYFAGGNCITGGGGSWGGGSAWLDKANIIHCAYTPDNSGSVSGPPYNGVYERCGDMLIVYLSKVAPDYEQPIQTMGHSTGGMPTMDVGIYLNTVYADRRYAINRVTLLDASCTYYPGRINSYLNSSVDGEQCWIDNYYSSDYGWLSMYPDVLTVNFRVDDVNDHGLAVNWYRSSLTSSNMNSFNGGVVAGAYWSVIGPGKNLQLASRLGLDLYNFNWYGSLYSGYLDFRDESLYPGKLPEPVTLILPGSDAVLAEGVLFTCEESENAVGYELLMGSDPYRVMDFEVISDTAEPPMSLITEIPDGARFWTIRAYDEFGSTIYADPIAFPWLTTVVVPDDERKIQTAIDMVGDGSTVIVRQGVYYENIDFGGKNIVLRSVDPCGFGVTARTIIYGDGTLPVFTFSGSEDPCCELRGFTITGGYGYSGGGICGNGCAATISDCILIGNEAKWGGGIQGCHGLVENSILTDNNALGNGGAMAGCHGTIRNCLVVDNTAADICGGLNNCDGEIINCTIVGNSAVNGGGAVHVCDGSITNCILWDNGENSMLDSVDPCYSCFAGALGLGNIDADPCFVDASAGDYHLRWDSLCVDAGDASGTYAGLFDIDGEPRVMRGSVDMGYDEVGEKQADFTRDGAINAIDMGMFVDAWLSGVGDDGWNSLADLHEDGRVDLLDWAVFADDWLWEAAWY